MVNDGGALVKQVKEANDIVDVVGTYLSLRPAGPTFKGLCPFHQDHRPSFDVDPRRQRYRCWSCGKFGDVISFVQEHERLEFREALELLARRANISLEKKADSPHQRTRALMLDVVRWAANEYHQALLDAPFAEAARKYLGERRLLGETIRRYGLGYAPIQGDWLVQRADQDRVSLELLEQVGLAARRHEGRGHYDRFRDRVMFPIRNTAGHAVGFGGRILPESPLKDRAPKYYNSAETMLFSKGEQLYGLDMAKAAGMAAGYLAVVEGYTDVLMAHQLGVKQVVATMGTALNARQVHHLARYARRVVLVFDADAGGNTGVDRALEIFASQNIDLRVATLPEGLDPCDLLVQRGVEPFKAALEQATDALDFKLNQLLPAAEAGGVEGRRQAVDALLGVIALAPAMPGRDVAVKRELMVTRIAQRLGLMEETVWARLKELQHQRRPAEPVAAPAAPPKQAMKAAAEERELLECLLGEPALVAEARTEIPPAKLQHPGLRRLLAGLYTLLEQGQTPDLDHLRPLIENPALASYALKLQDVGRMNGDAAGWLRRLVQTFKQRALGPVKQDLHNQLNAASDHEQALELLRRLQKQNPN